MIRRRVLFAICALPLLLACRPELASEASAAPVKTPAVAPAAAAAVTKIVFVDKQGACACTRERADLSWTALQTALGKPARLPVERLYLDTQPEKVAPLLAMKPVLVVPGVYLLDAAGKLVEQLQGEISEDQVRAALPGAP